MENNLDVLFLQQHLKAKQMNDRCTKSKLFNNNKNKTVWYYYYFRSLNLTKVKLIMSTKFAIVLFSSLSINIHRHNY
jgi:hypothetical protein